MQHLNALDYTAIGVYFLILIFFGFYLATRASRSLEDYFLGGRKLPWWALGMSGTASWFDITGTMLIVSFLYMLGPRGIYIEFRGGACLVLAFMLVFAGKWHRRSGCMTAAEWLTYRFGEGPGGQFARIVGALGAIAATIGGMAYLIKGVGAFLSMFLPWSPVVCALGMVSIATLYTAASGFYGVVITDVIQTVVIAIAVVVITTMAVMHVADVPDLDEFARTVTQSDFIRHAAEKEAMPDVTGRENWTTSAPSWHLPMQDGYTPYRYLVMFALFYLLKNVMAGMGSGGDQRYFGARNERECGLLSAMWGGLIMIRWPMMIGFALLGLFLVDGFFGEGKDEAVWKAQVIIKQSAVTEQHPDLELDLETASIVAGLLPKEQWEEGADELLGDPTANAAIIAGLERLLGRGWEEALKGLAEQERILNRIVPKSQWDEIVADVLHQPELVRRLKVVLGEENFDTKLKLISHEGTINPEKILPAVLLHRIPVGIRGLLLVALIAASMSTFDTSINGASAFFIRDLYQRFLRPAASNRELMLASYSFAIVLVAGGFGMAHLATSINDIWGWIIMSLTAGMAVPGILRLYWWRFNSGGVVASSVTGLTLPFLQRFAYPELHE